MRIRDGKKSDPGSGMEKKLDLGSRINGSATLKLNIQDVV
jgi:hypothetical protein